MTESIPYFDLPAQIRDLRKDLDVAIARSLDNCSFCLGPDVVQFEKDFAKYTGAEHCVGFNSGTSALHVAMIILGVGQHKKNTKESTYHLHWHRDDESWFGDDPNKERWFKLLYTSFNISNTRTSRPTSLYNTSISKLAKI